MEILAHVDTEHLIHARERLLSREAAEVIDEPLINVLYGQYPRTIRKHKFRDVLPGSIS